MTGMPLNHRFEKPGCVPAAHTNLRKIASYDPYQQQKTKSWCSRDQYKELPCILIDETCWKRGKMRPTRKTPTHVAMWTAKRGRLYGRIGYETHVICDVMWSTAIGYGRRSKGTGIIPQPKRRRLPLTVTLSQNLTKPVSFAKAKGQIGVALMLGCLH